MGLSVPDAASRVPPPDWVALVRAAGRLLDAVERVNPALKQYMRSLEARAATSDDTLAGSVAQTVRHLTCVTAHLTTLLRALAPDHPRRVPVASEEG
jgi:hypothetical protein